MADFTDAIFELLPERSELKKPDNQLRKVLDKSVGEWFDNNGFDVNNLFLNTATCGFLDLFGADYGIHRNINEVDDSYRERIVQEKLDHLTPSYLQELYGLTLYVFVNQFNAEDNTLTSDNYYIGGVKMANATSEIQSILDKKFILNEEIVWLSDNAVPLLRNIPVSVLWDNDNNNLDGNRPSSLTLKLYAKNTIVGSATVSEDTDWEYVFEDMPIYDMDGAKYVYEVVVDDVTDYSLSIIEFNVYLDYNPELKTLHISKVWNDNDDEHGLRPDSLLMSVSANSHVYGSVIVNNTNSWAGEVDVPVRLNKENADYTWTEESISKYDLQSNETEGNNTVITNIYNDIPEPP